MEGVQCGTKLSNNCLLSMFILTVEDEFLISEYLRAILEGGGHKVIATFDAGEAIEVLERVREIQLVITDIDMPGSMDGGSRCQTVTNCPATAFLSQSPMGRPKFSLRYDTSSRPSNVTAPAGFLRCLQ
jgi:PleD family two-component response regulator